MSSSPRTNSPDIPEFLDDQERGIARLRRWARDQLAYQGDPAITAAWSDDEVGLERDLAERIRASDRQRRWKRAQATAAVEDRALATQTTIDKADIADLLTARKAIAVQRRITSAPARLASLYRHRTWSLFTLTGVVIAGMLWSATNVQHNIAPGGVTDPLYWFSYLVELMISACLAVIMVGTNKVGEYDIRDNRTMVAASELALLGLTVTLNTYPYWHSGLTMAGVGVHAIPPVMIGVALTIHHGAGIRYGLAIAKQAAELPADDLAQIAALNRLDAYRLQPSVAQRFRASEDADLWPSLPGPRHPDPARNHTAPIGTHGRRSVHGYIPRATPLRARAARPLRPHHRLRPTPHLQTIGETYASDRVKPTRTSTVDAPPGRTDKRTTVAGNGHRAIDQQEILRIAKEHPDWSNRRIASEYGCSHSAVDKVFRAVPRPGTQAHPTPTTDQSSSWSL